MPRAYYENFDVVVTRAGDSTYKASVLDALGGDESVTFTLNGAPEEVLTAVTRNFALGTSAPPPASDGTNGSNRSKVGQFLSESLLPAAMQNVLRRTSDLAQSRNSFVRLRLNLTDVPELVGLPWEMLRLQLNDLALNIRTSVVRYQSVPTPQAEVVVKDKPLRMLVVVSNPAVPRAPALNVEAEWKKINETLQPLINRNLIVLERLPRATLSDLDNRFFDQTKPIHIFHYIGHGDFDKASGKGHLVFESDVDVPPGSDNDVTLVDGARLGQSLGNQTSLRLASLNSCEGAASSTSDSFSGVAQHLLQTATVPIVVAMRRAISDDIATAFGHTFYEWLLVNNVAVDTAMTRARLKMRDVEQKRIGDGDPTEWSTPILFMRSHDGYLWNFSTEGPIIVPDNLPEDIDAGMVKHYLVILNALTKAKLVPFLGLDVNLLDRPAEDDWQPGNSKLPSYRELVSYLVTLTKHPLPFIPALADVSQYALLQYRKDEERGEGTFFSDLGNIFACAQAPSELHRFWARLAKHNHTITGTDPTNSQDFNRRFLIVSSTYDNLLERAFCDELDRFHVLSYVAHGDYQGRFRHTVFAKNPGGPTMPQSAVIVEQANNYGALYDLAPVILKIPGTVGDTGPRLTITEDQYLDFFSKRELASIVPSQLLTKLRSSNHLFLGYNVREWCMRALLYRIWEDNKAPVVSWTVQEQATDVETNYWEACGVRPINVSLNQYLSGLRRSCHRLLPDAHFWEGDK
ncbi:MAG: CHAT domain-containing protein [bacterium]